MAWGAIVRFTLTSACTKRWTIKRRQVSTGMAKLWPQRPPSLDRQVVLTLGSTLDYLLAFIRELSLADYPGEPFNRLSQTVEEVFQLAPSKKPLNHRDLGRLEPTPTLTNRVEMAEGSVYRTELCRARFVGYPKT